MPKGNKSLFNELQGLLTEHRNRRSMNIDTKSVPEILRIINQEDKKVARAVRREIPHIARAVDLVVEALSRGGRLIYVGAGTSGRLGILDATECPPTYGTDPTMIQGVIAGGKRAVFRSIEGAEDHAQKGRRAVEEKRVSEEDVVCGIAASRRTPFVVAAIQRARELGAKTIYVTTNPRGNFYLDVDVAICPAVGPEVIMGSTRMKSGTAQKLVLNMITTAAMIRLGKVYENMMVDLQIKSRKLEERAKRVVMIVTGISYQRAEKALRAAGGHVKTAIVMVKAEVSASEARRRLNQADGFVRVAIGEKSISTDKHIRQKSQRS
ncbi:MAG: N-acetylmuramic acid 6-phosphate etherase [Bacteroidota bacterium]